MRNENRYTITKDGPESGQEALGWLYEQACAARGCKLDIYYSPLDHRAYIEHVDGLTSQKSSEMLPLLRTLMEKAGSGYGVVQEGRKVGVEILTRFHRLSDELAKIQEKGEKAT